MKLYRFSKQMQSIKLNFHNLNKIFLFSLKTLLGQLAPVQFHVSKSEVRLPNMGQMTQKLGVRRSIQVSLREASINSFRLLKRQNQWFIPSALGFRRWKTLEVTTWGTSLLADLVLKTTAGALILTFKRNVWPMSGMSLNLNYCTNIICFWRMF